MAGAPSFLWRSRHGIYYFRLVIPEALRPALGGRREFRRSLQSGHRPTALRRARTLVTRAELVLNELQEHMARKKRNKNEQTGSFETRLIEALDIELPDGTKVGAIRADYGGDQEKEGAAVKAAISSLHRKGSTAKHKSGPKLSEVIERYCREYVQAGNWTEKTEAENRAIYALFTRIVGDVPFASLAHEQTRAYKETLLRLPANLNKSPRYQSLSIDEILALDDIKPMATNTINKNLTRISSLFEWAVRHGYTDKNYAEKLNISRKQRPRDERHTFDSQDLRRLFESEEYRAGFQWPFQYWVPLIGLYTGARLEEICRLHVTDVYEESGTWVIDINNNADDKGLKTPAAVRLVPVHKTLLTLGLDKFVRQKRSQGTQRLFSELTRQRDGYSSRVSKWFARYRERCGIIDAGKTFHSFRHTLVDTLKQLGVDENVVGALVGHEQGAITFQRYGKDYRVERLKKAVDLIDYELEHPLFKER